MHTQVVKGIHGGIREVALKMLQDVEDPQGELESFTQVSICGIFPVSEIAQPVG